MPARRANVAMPHRRRASPTSGQPTSSTGAAPRTRRRERLASWRANGTAGGCPSWLLDSDYVDDVDLGILSQQVGTDLGEGPRDLAAEMGLTRIFALERVEDAVGRALELERVPSYRALLRRS